MSRSIFGTWGAELDDSEFACALAGIGVGPWLLDLPPEKVQAINESWFSSLESEPQPVARWYLPFPERLRSDPGAISAQRVAEFWREAIKNLGTHRGFPRLRLEVDTYPQLEYLPWIVRQLGRLEVGLLGLFITWPEEHEPLYKLPSWRWPLRVACMATARGEQLSISLCNEFPVKRGLARVYAISPEARECDLLLLADPISESLSGILSSSFPIRASAVVALTRLSDAWPVEWPLLYALQSQVRAGAFAHSYIVEADRGKWFTEVVYNLSHNLPFDAALLGAALRNESLNQTEEFGLSPLLFASRSFLELTRLEKRIFRFAQAMARHPPETIIDVPAEAGGRLGLASGRQPVGEAGKLLKDRLEAGAFRFDRESDEATGFAALTTAKGSSVIVTPSGGVARYLQSQIYEATGIERIENALLSGQRYVIRVRIAPPDEHWLIPKSGGVFPEPEFPPDVDRNVLTVVFIEPKYAPDPQMETIFLPREGASSVCQFLVSAREPGLFEGRITVLHKNRILQTVLLRSRVVERRDEIRDTDHIDFDIEAVVRQAFSGLSGRDKFQFAMIANHSTTSGQGVTAFSDNHAVLRVMDGQLQKPIDAIRSRLSQLSDDMDKVKTPSLKDKTLLEGLRHLARHGSLLYGALVPDVIDETWVKDPGRIQIISAHPEAFLPIEFVYDRPSPSPKEEAKLCTNAPVALRNGRCDKCSLSGVQWRKIICPLGFWGMRHIIERHMFDREVAKKLNANDFALQQEPVQGRARLTVLTNGLFAASSRADTVKRGLTDRVFNALRAATKPTSSKVDDWKEWRKKVKRVRPTLLLLIPHTFSDAQDIPTMEIGNDQLLPLDQVDADHVRADKDAPLPVVALLGCETAVVDRLYCSFVTKFRQKGAALIVSTLSTVLGRHAGPVAEAMIDELKKTNGDRSVGDVMLRVRQRTLASGIPMGMSLVAYGDADWRL
jgi:hypothetical protein